MSKRSLFWEYTLLSYMKEKNKYQSDYDTVNSGTLDNLLRVYNFLMLKGYSPIVMIEPDKPELSKFSDYTVFFKIKNELELSLNIVDSFLRGLYILTRKGVVPFKVYDPLTYKKQSGKNIFEQITSKIDNLAFIGVLGAAGYYYFIKRKK